MTLHLVLGGPGCGKTEALLDRLERELDAGAAPESVAFVAFTRQAAYEARSRAAARFDLTEDQLPFFRTIHSLVFRQLGLRRSDLLDGADWRRFADLVHEPLTRSGDPDAVLGARHSGDRLLGMVELARNRGLNLEETWRGTGEWFRWRRVERFAEALRDYKATLEKLDFGDLLERYLAEGAPAPVEVAFVDEAQDLTELQWRVLERALAPAETLYVAGDDDQAIYAWAGASLDRFLRLDGGFLRNDFAEVEVLKESHRLPRTVHRHARRLARRIVGGYEKHFTASGREGYLRDATRQEFERLPLHESSWYLLARHRYLLDRYVELARRVGVPYSLGTTRSVPARHARGTRAWETLRNGRAVLGSDAALALELARRPARDLASDDLYHARDLDLQAVDLAPWYEALVSVPRPTREYYVRCLRRGFKLEDEPRVRVDTIHGVKGGEADHVVLRPELSARADWAYQRQPVHEHRVFYVGATRAREGLTTLHPDGPRSYPLQGRR